VKIDYAVKSGAANGAAIIEKLSLEERVNQFFRHNWTALLGAALALLLLQDIFGTHGLIAMRKSQKEARQVQQEITSLDQENQKLEENVRALRSDPAAIERIAREEMGLARPGEYIFKLPPKPSTPDSKK
jgi:cell division protein FtsB